jgi:transposase
LVTLGHDRICSVPISGDSCKRRYDIVAETRRRWSKAEKLAIVGLSPDQRVAIRAQRSKPLVDDLERWMRQERRKLSSRSPLAKALEYNLKRWPALSRFLDDGRICMTNNAAERAVRGIAMGRKNWTFAGSDSGGRRAAAIYTLIETAKLNDVDPRAWLADVLARIADHPARHIAELLPWNWCSTVAARAA